MNHGMKGYKKGCRCEICRRAMSEYSKEYYERRKANGGNRLTQYGEKETPEELKRSNDAWRRRFEVEWGLA